MAEKVKVSREVAEFIKSYEDNVNGYPGWENHLILEHSRAYFESFEGAKEECLCMKNIDPLQLAEMLVNGYEIEQTPEEILLNLYNQTWATYNRITDNQNRHGGNYENGLAKGIELALDTLGIEIEGINK